MKDSTQSYSVNMDSNPLYPVSTFLIDKMPEFNLMYPGYLPSIYRELTGIQSVCNFISNAGWKEHHGPYARFRPFLTIKLRSGTTIHTQPGFILFDLDCENYRVCFHDCDVQSSAPAEDDYCWVFGLLQLRSIKIQRIK